MKNKEEFKRLLENVKAKAKVDGKKLLNEDIAKRLGITRTYLSDLLGVPGKDVTNKHIEDFKAHFREYLDEDAVPFDADDPLNVERAKVVALERKLALTMSMVYQLMGRPRSYHDCLDDIENDTIAVLTDLRRSGRKNQA